MKGTNAKTWKWIALILALLIPLCAMSCMSYDAFLKLYNADESPDSSSESSGNTNGSAQESGGSSLDREPNSTVTSNTQVVINNASQNDVAYAAAQGLRSSVSIYCKFTVTVSGGRYSQTTTGTSAGSGVIYRLDGNTGSAFIITNYHVVYNSNATSENGISEDISVYLYGMENSTAYAIPATYVGGSMYYDIAVLRVEGSSVLQTAAKNGSAAAVTIADSDLVAPGQTAIAVGNPESYGISVTKGIISVTSEYISMTASDGATSVSFRVIRIDTAVNSGNSGGGLFNADGALIGIVNAKVSSDDVENIGYAIPSNVSRAIADNIIDYCYGKECKTVMRGLLGITVSVSAYMTAYDTETGFIVCYEKVSVAEVTAGGLGEKILQKDDIITAIQIEDEIIEITRQYHLIDAMLDVRVGDTVTITVERNGETVTVSTVITEDCLTAY